MINIFVRPTYIGNKYPEFTNQSSALRISSRIRGEEIGQYLGARVNPQEINKDDICIYVKPKFIDTIKSGAWIDYLDSKNLIYLLKDRPDLNIIAATTSSYDYLVQELPNKIVLIPSHHLNVDYIRRKRTEVNTAGYIGSPSPKAIERYKRLGEKLKTVGFNFNTCFNFQTRQDAINLYTSIDVFVIDDWYKENDPHKVPTKIINAASFGIPTIAYPLKGYEEIEGYYVKAHTIEEILEEIVKFKDEKYYSDWSDKVYEMAKKYHINAIKKLYRQLT